MQVRNGRIQSWREHRHSFHSRRGWQATFSGRVEAERTWGVEPFHISRALLETCCSSSDTLGHISRPWVFPISSGHGFKNKPLMFKKMQRLQICPWSSREKLETAVKKRDQNRAWKNPTWRKTRKLGRRWEEKKYLLLDEEFPLLTKSKVFCWRTLSCCLGRQGPMWKYKKKFM